MKKRISEIKGTLLSKKQMKNLQGGGPKVCPGGSCTYGYCAYGLNNICRCYAGHDVGNCSF